MRLWIFQSTFRRLPFREASLPRWYGAMKTSDNPMRRRRILLVFIGAVYLSACLVVYRNNQLLEDLKRNRLGQASIAVEAGRVKIHDAVFLRTLAEKSQLYSHNPALVDRLYREALWKSPADYESFAAFAEYLNAKQCCPDEISSLWKRAVRRCPTNASVHMKAGLHHFVTDDRATALRLLRRSLELDARGARDVYSALDSLGAGQEIMIAVTPQASRAEIELMQLAANRWETATPQLKTIAQHLMNLSPLDDLTVARASLKFGWDELTQMHAFRKSDLTPASFWRNIPGNLVTRHRLKTSGGMPNARFWKKATLKRLPARRWRLLKSSLPGKVRNKPSGGWSEFFRIIRIFIRPGGN
jgi:hypothetical protein